MGSDTRPKTKPEVPKVLSEEDREIQRQRVQCIAGTTVSILCVLAVLTVISEFAYQVRISDPVF